VFFTVPVDEEVEGLAASDLEQLSVAAGPGDDTYLALAAASDCAAEVVLLRPANDAVELLECFGDGSAPLAIASAEGLVVVQVGDDLMQSTDDGNTFTVVGAPSPTDAPSSSSS
jgi:hypothetical protein